MRLCTRQARPSTRSPTSDPWELSPCRRGKTRRGAAIGSRRRRAPRQRLALASLRAAAPASLAPLREASAVALAAALARFAVLLQSPERLLDVVGDFIDSATNETARDSRRR